MELALVSLLHAVPKAWRVTIALTQPPAVEPLRWGLRAVVAQCFCSQPFFLILLPPELKTDACQRHSRVRCASFRNPNSHCQRILHL
jgi:hypothetical protein